MCLGQGQKPLFIKNCESGRPLVAPFATTRTQDSLLQGRGWEVSEFPLVGRNAAAPTHAGQWGFATRHLGLITSNV